MTKSQLWAALWMAALISELLVFNFDSLLILSLYHNGIKALEAEALLQEWKLSQLFFPQYPLLIKSHIILRTAYSLILAFHCSCLKPSSWHTFLTPLMNKGLLWDLSSVIQFSSLYSPSPWICWIWISVCTSPLSIFQPPQPHSLWLPPDSVKDDKENNKPSIYVISCNMMFSQCRGCEAGLQQHDSHMHAKLGCTDLIYGTPSATTIIVLNCIFSLHLLHGLIAQFIYFVTDFK